jgi:uncharacterized protein (TIGR00730 family)
MRRICVFCGSNSGRLAAYREAATRLGRLLAMRGLGLVYGGASVGLMGAVADAALGAGGEVVGVIPRGLMDRELGHRRLTALHVVESMHQRKRMMADLADAFIALPGGAGTLEEIFEIWTWAQLGDHEKPCGLLNVAGFYDRLIGFLDHAAGDRFMRPEHRAMLLTASSGEALLAAFAAYRVPRVQKWIEPAQT